MNHVEEHITAYIHGEFSEEDRQRISDHLIDCASCQRHYKEIMQLQQAINLIEPSTASAHFSAEVMDRIELVKSAENQVDWILEEMQEMEEIEKDSSFSPFPWYMVASAMMVIGVFFMHREMHPEMRPPEEVFASNEPVLEAPWKEVPQIWEEEAPELTPQPLSQLELADLLREWDIMPRAQEPELPEIKDSDAAPVQADFDRDWSKEPKKEIVEMPEQSHEKIQLNRDTEEALQSAIDVNEQLPQSVKGNKHYQAPAYWLYKIFNKDGSIGRGSVYHVALNSTLGAVLLNRRWKEVSLQKKSYIKSNTRRLELDLIERQTVTTNDFLKKLSFKKGVGKDLYQHSQITYFLCLLVNEGQTKLTASLDDALSFLIEQQNKDGGWDFKWRKTRNDPFTSSNTLATGWAVLALNEARQVRGLKIRKKIMPSIDNSQRFLKSMTDPRNGQCGFKMRSDGKHLALCTVMATMARYAVKKPRQLRSTTAYTKEWVKSGMERQKINYPKRADYDFIWFSKLFSAAIGESEAWEKSTDNFLQQVAKKLPRSSWGALPKIARQLFLEIIKNNRT